MSFGGFLILLICAYIIYYALVFAWDSFVLTKQSETSRELNQMDFGSLPDDLEDEFSPLTVERSDYVQTSSEGSDLSEKKKIDMSFDNILNKSKIESQPISFDVKERAAAIMSNIRFFDKPF
jgi:hypothetical protein